MAFSNVGGQGGQCSSSDGGRSVYRCLVTFPDLNAPPFGGEDFQTNLIMPEPCRFLSQNLPVCSVIRPTNTNGIARACQFLTDMGLFRGQSQMFFSVLVNWRPKQMRLNAEPRVGINGE